ncbi:MAG: hypothetical protein ACE5HY_04520 [Candidatus Hydrothermarchaeales archaeon]
MKQKAHAWVALRALKHINDTGKAPKLVELISYYISDVWDGAWLPDTLIRDMSYGHIFKMDSDPQVIGPVEERRKVTYSELKRRLTGKRLCLNYAKDSSELRKPIWVHDTASGHLPDRVIALTHGIIDMLKMGDYPLAFYAKGKKTKEYLMKDLAKQKIKDLSLSPNFSARQIAMMFFMVSHYICDAHMPLHCDLRDRSMDNVGRRLPDTLHPSIEKKWEESFPAKKTLAIHDYTTDTLDDIVSKLPDESLIELDSNQDYALSERITKPKKNEWDEMVNICRVSYAFSREWISQPHNNTDDLIQDTGEDEFKKATNFIFHDAVESVARIWCKAWTIYTK